MERHRDIRRGNMTAAAAAANGLSRRRPRSSASTTGNSLRDSPEEDGAVELQETTRLRDRAGKKERDRLNRNKRRRERLMLGGHREEGGEDSTEDSIDDDDEDEDDESGHVRMRPPIPSAHSNHHLHRKTFPPVAAKVVRATTWKVSDEMGFSVPKKARSASTKRAHESWVSGGVVGGGSGEQAHRQASTSPARPSAAPTPAPASPSSSTASIRKKMKPIGAKPKHKPPKPSPVQDDIEIEVAEVLYGLMRQSHPSRQEAATNSSKLDSRDANGSGNDAKSRVSSPISAPPLVSKLPQNSSSITTPVSAVAPKRKRPRPVKFEEENTVLFANKNDLMSSNKINDEQLTKTEASLTILDKNSGSNESRSGISLDFGSSEAKNVPLDAQQELKTVSNLNTASKPVAEESIVRADDQTNDIITSPKKESSCSKADFDSENATATIDTPASVVESRREENFKIDLMAPPSKSSPERDGEIGSVTDSKPMASDTEMKMEPDELKEKEKENVDINCKDIEAVVLLEKKTEAASVDECESQKSIAPKHTMLDPQIDSEKDDNKDCGPNNVRQQQLHIQQQQQHQSKTTRNDPKLEIAAQSISSVPLPMNITGWPGGLTPMGRRIHSPSTNQPVTIFLQRSALFLKELLVMVQMNTTLTRCLLLGSHLHKMDQLFRGLWVLGDSVMEPQRVRGQMIMICSVMTFLVNRLQLSVNRVKVQAYKLKGMVSTIIGMTQRDIIAIGLEKYLMVDMR